MSKRATFLAGVALSLGSLAATAAPVELITNGGFETGTLAGWTTTTLAGSSGGISAHTGVTAPISGLATVGAAGGTFYAISDQTGPGTHVLQQVFTVPAGASSVMVSFDMFANDWSDTGPIDAGGLDHTIGPNQHVRVDIMTLAAGDFSTAVADIVTTLLAPMVDGGADPNAYTAYGFDISAFVAPGGSYKIRFGEVDNQFFFNMGVDNVSITAEVVPTPATLALLGASLLAAGLARRGARVQR